MSDLFQKGIIVLFAMTHRNAIPPQPLEQMSITMEQLEQFKFS